MAKLTTYQLRNLRAIALGYSGYGQQRAYRKKLDAISSLNPGARKYAKQNFSKAKAEEIIEAEKAAMKSPEGRTAWQRLADELDYAADPKWVAFRKNYGKGK